MKRAILALILLAGCADRATPEVRPEVHYRSCDEAPGEIHRGDPGYSRQLDRDGDGKACDG